MGDGDGDGDDDDDDGSKQLHLRIFRRWVLWEACETVRIRADCRW